VKVKLHRQIPKGAILKSVTIVKEGSGKYYASLLCEVPEPENQRPTVKAEDARILGIDYAMQGLAVFSDGTDAEYPGYYRKGQEKLRKEQRRLSHCRKGSRNYGKQRKRVAKCHRKIRNQRTDYLHKLSRSIVNRYDAVAVEDIDMKTMSRGMHFGKSVMDNGFGTFRDMLAYKLEREGKKLVKVDRFYPSSKRCSCCGAVKKELSLSERIYICPCGNRMDRDVNAAINIREEGRRLLGA
jgi:putative transposase